MTTITETPPSVAGSRRGQAAGRDGTTAAGILFVAVVVALPGLAQLGLSTSHTNLARVTLLLCAAPMAWWWAAGRSSVEPAPPLLRWPVPGFLAAFVLAALFTPSPSLALWGAPGRLNGPLTYGACIALFWVLWRRGSPRLCRVVLLGWAWSSMAVAGHAVLLWAGYNPLGTTVYREFGGAAAGLLGNPDFAAVYFAMSAPVALWSVVSQSPGAGRSWRGLGLLALVAALLLTETVQAPLALAAGGLPWLAHWLLRRRPAARRQLLVIGGPPAGLAGLAVAGGLFGHGPLAALREHGSVDSRLVDWVAAWRMFTGEPLTGVGPGQFMWHYAAVRPPDEIPEYGWALFSDQAHSVPIDLLAAGGVVLPAAYLLM